MRALGVVDQIEPVDLPLELVERVGEGLLVEVAEQGLLEPFVLALGSWFVGFPGDRFDAERSQVSDQLPEHPASGWVQRGAVVGEQPLRNTVSGDAFLHYGDRSFRGFAPGDVGGDGEAGMAVDELKDHALAAAGEDVLGRVELPARVRCGIHEPPIRGPRLLPRFGLRNTRVTEDPRQRRDRRDRLHTEGPHLLVNTDRAVIEPGPLQCGAHRDGLRGDLAGEFARAAFRASRPRLQRRRRPLQRGTSSDRVERLSGDPMLQAERRDRSPRSIGGPLRDRETDAGINGLNTTHPPHIEGEVSGQERTEPSEIY